jgi:hypothetical protein
MIIQVSNHFRVLYRMHLLFDFFMYASCLFYFVYMYMLLLCGVAIPPHLLSLMLSCQV